MDKVAEVMLIGDYLDIPGLCYEAYSRIVQGLVKIVTDYRSTIYFLHNLSSRKKPFKEVARILEESDTPMGCKVAKNIGKLFKELKEAHDIAAAEAAFNRHFKHEWEYLQFERIETN